MIARGGLLALVLGALAIAAPPGARADAPHVVWIAGRPGPEAAGRARRWQRRLGRAIASRGAEVTTDDETWARSPEGIDATRLARLARIEDLLRESRELRARLEQGRAIERLVEAERIALGSLDVPGASAWYAETQIALAVAAAESGERALADEAIARAASVDPGREIGAAEAPPDLLARAHAIARAVATGPRGRFELRTSVPATVWLDGRRLGDSPIRIEASEGAHVLRVEAPGHRTWARLVDVLEGGRPPLEIALSPEPAVEAARALRRACDEDTIDRAEEILTRLAELDRAPRTLWLVEVSGGAMDRAIVIACRPGGCGAPLRLDVARVESALPSDPDGDPDPLTPVALADARAWLDEPIAVEPPPPPPAEWWQEPWPWIVAGVVAAGAIGVAVGATYQAPDAGEQRVISIGTEPSFPWVP